MSLEASGGFSGEKKLPSPIFSAKAIAVFALAALSVLSSPDFQGEWSGR